MALPLLLAVCMLGGCGVNEWRMSYRTLSEEQYAPLAEGEPIELVDCSTYADELYLKKVDEAEEDAQSIGYSHFEINRSRSGAANIKGDYVAELEEFARSIGADLVVYRVTYVDTSRAQELDTWDVPRTDTSYITSGRGKSRSTTTITTTSWETRLITRSVSIDRFTASAAYFRREEK